MYTIIYYTVVIVVLYIIVNPWLVNNNCVEHPMTLIYYFSEYMYVHMSAQCNVLHIFKNLYGFVRVCEKFIWHNNYLTNFFSIFMYFFRIFLGQLFDLAFAHFFEIFILDQYYLEIHPLDF